jgi:hypothetical protein
MKAGIFALTKNEQRVVILVLVLLLAAAFIRYRYNVKSFPPNKPTEDKAGASPIQFDESQAELEQSSSGAANRAEQLPSRRSSP